jgi:hypothetical protein
MELLPITLRSDFVQESFERNRNGEPRGWHTSVPFETTKLKYEIQICYDDLSVNQLAKQKMAHTEELNASPCPVRVSKGCDTRRSPCIAL